MPAKVQQSLEAIQRARLTELGPFFCALGLHFLPGALSFFKTYVRGLRIKFVTL
jgi:hypothetical protein